MRTGWPAILALFAGAQLSAQVAAPPTNFDGKSDAELQESIDAFRVQPFGAACARDVPLFAELSRRHPDAQNYKMGAIVARAFCAYDEKRYADSLRLFEQAETESHAQGFDSLGLADATLLDDGAETLARLRTVAAQGNVGILHPQLVTAALKTIRLKGLEPQADEIAYQVAGSPGFARIDPRIQGALAYGALGHAARTGQLDRVNALLPYVRSPYAAEPLLALRKFEPLWPQVEAYVGANLADVTNGYLAWTASRLAEKSDDTDRVSAYAEAVFWAGRDEEAAGLAEKWLDRPGRDGKLEEGDGWALNIKAYALSALGRQAEADKVFDDLAKLSPDDHPWVVNFVINREARLVEQGRWQEGLAASEIARPVAAKHGSDYARMLVASDRACAFHQLGRNSESETELSYVRANFSAAAGSAIEALLCAGRDDEATDLFMKVLEDDTIRDPFLGGLRDDRFDLYWNGPSRLRDAYDLMMARPELKNEALKYVRMIPDRFVPLAYLRRQRVASGSP